MDGADVAVAFVKILAPVIGIGVGWRVALVLIRGA